MHTYWTTTSSSLSCKWVKLLQVLFARYSRSIFPASCPGNLYLTTCPLHDSRLAWLGTDILLRDRCQMCLPNVFSDWQTFLLAIELLALQWFPSSQKVMAILHWERLWLQLYALINFVDDSILLPKLWIIILFSVHHTRIVLYQFLALHLKMFSTALLIGLPIGITVFYTPHLWLSSVVQGIYNTDCILLIRIEFMNAN